VGGRHAGDLLIFLFIFKSQNHKKINSKDRPHGGLPQNHLSAIFKSGMVVLLSGMTG